MANKKQVVYNFDAFLSVMDFVEGYKVTDILDFRDHYQNLLNNKENEKLLIKYIEERKNHERTH